MTQLDEAPLLLLAGTLCDARVFAPMLDAMGMVAPTLKMEGADSAAEMARHILAVAPERFALCGFSLGAIVALEILAQAPERVDRLALLACNARAMPDEIVAGRREAGRKGGISYVDAVWDASVPAWRRDDAELRDTLHAMAADTAPETLRQQIEIAISRVDSRPRLSAIAVPTLVLCGTEDRVCAPELSREIAAAITGAELVLVEQAGHYVSLDQPQTVAAALGEWFARPSAAPIDRLPKEFT